ncbi:hypothetical protein [Klebsiella sp. PL-2018]|uniref:hypothetical protein n=1 Tax=Klebsiella sp. PL-2018 TaxID=2851540 RepID=UPI001C249D62|nr:hypothetical protein [Klebsiella sp. PL-2018]
MRQAQATARKGAATPLAASASLPLRQDGNPRPGGLPQGRAETAKLAQCEA